MRRCLWVGLVVILVPFLFAAAPPVVPRTPAQQSDAFFESPRVVHLAIVLDKQALESLRREHRKYVKATVTENGKTVYREVGVHLRGAAGSFRGIDDKPGLTLNMDKFGSTQTFHGMDKWHLCNSAQDASYLAEMVCGELYRAAGVPAARVTHAIVTINGRRRGLYYLKEGFDRHFRARNFKGRNGNFYDGGFLRDIDQKLQLVAGPGDPKTQPDLEALLAATKEKKPAERFAKLEKLLDMDRFITYLCLQVATWDWDGYPINRNNYRIYHDPKTGKMTFIPSGMDQMFADTNGTIFPGFQGIVARAVMDTPEGRARYLKRMPEILSKVIDAKAMKKRLAAYQKVIQPEFAAIDAGAGRDYPNHVQHLGNLIEARVASVEGQLKKVKK